MPGQRARASRRQVVRFCLVFVVLVWVLYALFFFPVGPGTGGFGRPVTRATVHTVHYLVGVLGAAATVEGSDVVTPALRLRVSDECNGMIAIVVFVSAVLAFPAPWRYKGIGMLGGAALLWILNVGRILALVYTALYLPGFFYEIHIYVAQSAVIAAGIVLWFFWAGLAVRTSRPTHSSLPS